MVRPLSKPTCLVSICTGGMKVTIQDKIVSGQMLPLKVPFSRNCWPFVLLVLVLTEVLQLSIWSSNWLACPFLPHSRHMEVPGPGIRSELQLPPTPQLRHLLTYCTGPHRCHRDNARSLTPYAAAGTPYSCLWTLGEAGGNGTSQGNSMWPSDSSIDIPGSPGSPDLGWRKIN